MRSTGMLLLVGFGACTGWWLIITGWRQPRRRLVHQIEQLQRTAQAAPTVPADDHRDPVRAIGSAVLRPDVRDRLARWVEPLRLIGRPLEVHVGLLVAGAFIGLVAPALVFALAATLDRGRGRRWDLRSTRSPGRSRAASRSALHGA